MQLVCLCWCLVLGRSFVSKLMVRACPRLPMYGSVRNVARVLRNVPRAILLRQKRQYSPSSSMSIHPWRSIHFRSAKLRHEWTPPFPRQCVSCSSLSLVLEMLVDGADSEHIWPSVCCPWSSLFFFGGISHVDLVAHWFVYKRICVGVLKLHPLTPLGFKILARTLVACSLAHVVSMGSW